jgi:large subunit ribosomal protein L19
MRNALIDIVESKSIKKNPPKFEVGDTVNVSVKISEGAKSRIQKFSGVIISRKGIGVNENFTVRRIVNNEGVERIFPVHAPSIVKVEVVRSAITRRAKLYFLRDRTGKAVRLKERWITKKAEKS